MASPLFSEEERPRAVRLWRTGRGKKEESDLTVHDHTVLKHSPNVPWRTVDGKGILVDLESGFYFSLNKTGQFIWGQIDGERTMTEIASRLVEHFEVEDEMALKDCLELAQRLYDQGLIVSVSA